MGLVDLAVPVRTHEQQAVNRLLAQHEIDESQCRAAGPLQVIHEEHDRPALRGDCPQHGRTRALCPHLRGQGVAGFGRHIQQCPELRYRRGQ
jgi:hypothetical protein